MTSMRLVAVFLIFFPCFVGGVSADEKLVPLEPIPNDRLLTRYDLLLHQAFHEVYAPNVVARMLAIPSFTREYVVGIVRDASGYHVLYLKANNNILYGGGLSTTRCFADLDPSIARGLIGAWARAIVNVASNRDRRIGLDGETYMFAVRSDGREMQAQTWSPDEGTTAALGVELGDTLATDCWTKAWLRHTPVSWYYDHSLATEAATLSLRLK